MLNSERAYVDLIFRATKKYASWDPEVIVVNVGDWGRMTRGPRGFAFWRKTGVFVREGNIYSDGKALQYGIPEPVEFGRNSVGDAWVISANGTQVDASLSVAGSHPAIAHCQIKGAFKFSSGRGAILAMENTMLTTIDPPGALKPLLEDPSMRGAVVVSEVHSCSSYARLLTADDGSIVALGLKVEPPIPDVASAGTTTAWVRNVAAGNFKSQVDKMGARVFCPLFRLVSLSDEETSMGIGRRKLRNGRLEITQKLF
ncbi:hypothetical protein DFH06DRAFT_1269615 [Mycena polygramma]|nr:hypothetical protein DFH06DRAFT_1269615 [Mycena polygramma]